MSPSLRIAIALVSLLHELLDRGHRFRFRADAPNVDGLHSTVPNLRVPRIQPGTVPVAPVANVEFRLLDAQEPKRPEDSSVAQDSCYTIQPQGHVGFLHLHADAMPAT